MAEKYTGIVAGNKITAKDMENALDTKQNLLSDNQRNAVNSGITATKVTTYDNYATTLSNMNFFPKGTILTFSSEAWNATTPAFKEIWKICDGTDSRTPNLTNKFLRGGATSGTSYNNPTATNTQSIVVPVPQHNHSIDDKQHNHTCYQVGWVDSNGYPLSGTRQLDNFAVGTSLAYTGITETNYYGTANASISVNTMPSYYTVIYIMKVA